MLTVQQAAELAFRQSGFSIRAAYHWAADHKRGVVALPSTGFRDWEEYWTAKQLAQQPYQQRLSSLGIRVAFTESDVENLWSRR